MNEPIVKCGPCRGEGVKPGPKACRVCAGTGMRSLSELQRDDGLADAREILDELDDELAPFGIREAS